MHEVKVWSLNKGHMHLLERRYTHSNCAIWL